MLRRNIGAAEQIRYDTGAATIVWAAGFLIGSLTAANELFVYLFSRDTVNTIQVRCKFATICDRKGYARALKTGQ